RHPPPRNSTRTPRRTPRPRQARLAWRARLSTRRARVIAFWPEGRMMMWRKALVLAALAAAAPAQAEAAATLAVTGVDRSHPGVVQIAVRYRGGRSPSFRLTPHRSAATAARAARAAARPRRPQAPRAPNEDVRSGPHLGDQRSRDAEPHLRAHGVRTDDAARPRRRHPDRRQARVLTRRERRHPAS